MTRSGVILALSLLAVAPGAGGCALPSQGTPVYMDAGTGRWWRGNGVLTEVSADGRLCHVHGRNRILIVEDKWVDCRRVHQRRPELPGER